MESIRRRDFDINYWLRYIYVCICLEKYVITEPFNFDREKEKKKKKTKKEKARILCKRLKRMEVTFYFYFYFFLCCEKKYFIPELSKHEDASVLENVNVQINFLIKDLLL